MHVRSAGSYPKELYMNVYSKPVLQTGLVITGE